MASDAVPGPCALGLSSVLGRFTGGVVGGCPGVFPLAAMVGTSNLVLTLALLGCGTNLIVIWGGWVRHGPETEEESSIGDAAVISA